MKERIPNPEQWDSEERDTQTEEEGKDKNYSEKCTYGGERKNNGTANPTLRERLGLPAPRSRKDSKRDCLCWGVFWLATRGEGRREKIIDCRIGGEPRAGRHLAT